MRSAIVEYFTQRHAIDGLALDPAPTRIARRVLVARARQKCNAAEAVAALSIAEAYLLMRDALLLFQEVLNEVGAGKGLGATLAGLGLSGEAVQLVTRVLTEALARPFPALEADVQEQDAETFRDLGEASAILNRALAGKVLTTGDLTARRARRIAVTAAVVLCAIIGLPVALRRPPATASAVFPGESFEAVLAVDGDVATEWLLPDNSPGWLDVRVSPARAISSVRLTNGHNRTFNDRAVHAFRIEAYSGERLVASANSAFPALLPAPQPVEVPLVAAKVDRVRVVVTSWFGLGAALAEVKID